MHIKKSIITVVFLLYFWTRCVCVCRGQWWICSQIHSWITHRNSISHHLLESTEEKGMRKTSGVEESCSEERKESYSSVFQPCLCDVIVVLGLPDNVINGNYSSIFHHRMQKLICMPKLFQSPVHNICIQNVFTETNQQCKQPNLSNFSPAAV